MWRASSCATRCCRPPTGSIPVKGDIPRELIDKMGELGFFGILIPEEYGGLGLGAFEYCLVAEELARGWMSVASHHRARQLVLPLDPRRGRGAGGARSR